MKYREDSRSDQLSHRAKIIKTILKNYNKGIFPGTKNDLLSSMDSEIEEDFKYPDHLSVERISRKKYEMEKLTWKDSDSRWAVLYLHGGGYVRPLKKNYKSMAGLYSEVGGGAVVYTVDYRVAPENPFPAALEDARDAYDFLMEEGYDSSNIIIAGDSAGGGLAMALCHTLKATWSPLPAGIIAMSPWTDLTASGSSYEENREIDLVLGNQKPELLFDNPYIGDADPRDPRISPMFGDFTGFPPMLIQVGTDEMLLSDSITVAEKAKAGGVKVRFTIYKGMFHVFQLAGTLMKESKMAWTEVKRFMNEL